MDIVKVFMEDGSKLRRNLESFATNFYFSGSNCFQSLSTLALPGLYFMDMAICIQRCLLRRQRHEHCIRVGD